MEQFCLFLKDGIYFLKKNKKDISLIYLNKAKEIDSNIPLLEKYIEEAQVST
ncbi:MAG TPA: hypothetical protein VNW06_08010 [Cytophagaceae bacterium]|jgi:hypothetical protein|nr:hypothetical protein [Cytophagaceae bacterium]